MHLHELRAPPHSWQSRHFRLPRPDHFSEFSEPSGCGWYGVRTFHHFFMGKVLRQDKTTLRRLLLHMRDGTMNEDDIAFIESISYSDPLGSRAVSLK